MHDRLVCFSQFNSYVTILMSTKLKTLCLVPLHEEMRYIDEYLTQFANPRFVRLDGDEFDPSKSEFTFSRRGPDRRYRELTFVVLDAGNRHVMGNVATVAAVTAAVLKHNPSYLVLVGLAGSLVSAEVGLADVVFSTAAKMWAPDKLKLLDEKKEVFADVNNLPDERLDELKKARKIVVDSRKSVAQKLFFRFRKDLVECPQSSTRRKAYKVHLRDKPMEELIPCCDKVLDGCEPEVISALKNMDPKVFFGTILGSEWVVDSATYVEFAHERNKSDNFDYYKQKDSLKAKPGVEGEGARRNRRWDKSDMLAVDMESYGFFMAVEALNANGQSVQAFSIRGISDLASGKSELQDRTEDRVRNVCVRNAAAVAVDFIRAVERWAG